MPVTSPPLLTPFVAPGPNHGQDEEEFNVNQQNFVDSQFRNVTEQNVLAVWIKNTADFVEAEAYEAEESASSASESKGVASVAAGRAEEAAATAQEAAGLPPLPEFGRVLHTEGADNSKSAAFTAETSNWYEIDSTGGGFPINPPVSPVLGDWFAISYTHSVNLFRRCNIAYNGQLMMGFADSLALTKGFKTYLFRYTMVDGVASWRFS